MSDIEPRKRKPLWYIMRGPEGKHDEHDVPIDGAEWEKVKRKIAAELENLFQAASIIGAPRTVWLTPYIAFCSKTLTMQEIVTKEDGEKYRGPHLYLRRVFFY